MIAVIDYGAGNLRSVANAVAALGYRPRVTGNPDDLRRAAAVILPGVGAAPDTVRNLRALGWDDAIREAVADGLPTLAVCVGMQVLFDETEEGGKHGCLGILPGGVRRLPPGLKVPHMGWNQVHQTSRHALFDGIPDGANFYFVHSYYAEPEDSAVVAGTTDYGISFCSALVSGNLMATQFHPEKSGVHGLRIYENFLRLAPVDMRRSAARRDERC
ncbi:MAG: imidazole glycerol phosphate synthase subunit HisH [Dehalococcoidia bacterium]|nr:imidazole glycerol phosphate synthase subunit HisH [Dehalococcoidia bacterium]